ncbi:hemerythrin HHE cation binding domain-containing protein [Coniochaeta ligniaria NRRL 30616]|uniref:Hemerythrin HHE cation binding domain-containing protein n=1 Tax=Coniochaeta ligniaria NRRL 30616 TaxID=1408157 RepID=A0A1J7IB97_9PEZI|nr:hemerythrin HHE cation binding domain-containing protein [Coniochaeta ligniaria NRRL 30616]
MAPIYADHPFPLINSPEFANKQNGVPTDLFDHCASEMACVHNLMVRGLNAIYLQAPHIKPADEKAFVNFIRIWHQLLHAHHSGEEDHFFPILEAMAGEKGMMEANVEQHHAFHDPLHAFHEYIEAVAAGKDKYDGQKIVGLIDAFGPMLMQHLADEIPTIQGLRKYGDKMADLQKKFDDEGEENMKKFGLTGLTIIFSMLDLHHEDGLWANWPPAPAVVNFLCRNLICWFVRDTTKFGACDRLGNMKPLYAVPA